MYVPAELVLCVHLRGTVPLLSLGPICERSACSSSRQVTFLCVTLLVVHPLSFMWCGWCTTEEREETQKETARSIGQPAAVGFPFDTPHHPLLRGQKQLYISYAEGECPHDVQLRTPLGKRKGVLHYLDPEALAHHPIWRSGT